MTDYLRVSGMYWGLTALELVDKLHSLPQTEVIAFIKQCQDEETGGISACTNHDPHLLHTLSAIQILCMYDRLDAIDTEATVTYVTSLQQPDGSFTGDKWGEVDTRFSFCAVATLALLNRLDAIDVEKAVSFVESCKNFDGGFGSRPFSESHAGLVYCCLGFLSITGRLDVVDRDALAWWLCERQLPSGGLNGRPEKLPDVCYSWWVLSSLTILGRLHWINAPALTTFILACQDVETGGFSDRPGDIPDPYHTLFGLGALSLLGHDLIKQVNPTFCMPQHVIDSDLVITLAYYWALFVIVFVVYVLLYEDSSTNKRYKSAGFYYVIKRLLSIPAINKFKRRLKKAQLLTSDDVLEQPRKLIDTSKTNTQLFFGLDDKGNSVFLKFVLQNRRLAEVILCVRVGDEIFTFPNKEKVVLYSTRGQVWTAGGLTVTILEPLRRLRLTFNGLLRSNFTEQVEHVKFTFLWNGANEPFHFPQDVPTSVLSDAVSKETWRSGDWINLLGDEKGYEQYGVLRGTVTYGSSTKNLYLHSFRKRYWGKGEHLTHYRDLMFVGVTEDGLAFNVGVKSYNKGCTHFKYGSTLNNYKAFPVVGHDINLEHVGETKIPLKSVFHFKAKNKLHKCVASLVTKKSVVATGYGIVTIVPCKYIFDTQEAKGFAYFWHESRNTQMDLPDMLLTEPMMKIDSNCYASSLTDCVSEVASLSGEKGQHLALASSMNSSKFVVPEGIVILTTAFSAHVETNTSLKEALTNLKHSRKANDIADSCQRIVDLFLSEPIKEDVRASIMNEIRNMKNAWVVRSSYAKFDHPGLKFFLDCSSNDVVQAVASCWSSLFTYESVCYRLENGYDLCGNVAVVVQKMVPAELCGVLYSCHPVSGDPSKIVIELNGSSIVLSKRWDGVVEKAVSAHGLSEEQTLMLGQIAVELENAFGFFCTITWRLYNKIFYVVQVQQITDIYKWTDEELLHEFDTPVMSGNQVQTLASIQEIAPGALTPLSSSIVRDLLSDSFYHAFGEKLIDLRAHRLVFNITKSVFRKSYRTGIIDVVKAMRNRSKEFKFDFATTTDSVESALEHLKTVGKRYGQATRECFTQTSLLSAVVGNKNVRFQLLLPFAFAFKAIHELRRVADHLRIQNLHNNFIRNGDLSHCPKAETMVQNFRERYGKRGIREFEFASKLWENEVIDELQFQCKIKNDSAPISTKKIRNRFYVKRKLVEFLSTTCKESLMRRLKLQEMVLDAFDNLRAMFKDLSEHMVDERLIIDSDLIYYFTWHELKDLVNRRDNSTITKASRRRKLYDVWDKACVPTFQDHVKRSRIKGKFVGIGDGVVGRACVVRNATELKQLVVEAIAVSKERGISCLLDARNATVLIKTGDIVRISREQQVVELLS
ncbi:hypothetical protein FQR65_LT08039 [Abscondita terminalis]|nr:hypothetical protein FQR65_LT08039 [Abscondita terminalis]